ncbi:unnamed protein product [Chironomus riparius]|uniref:non-specific serine/threonine protein kinase n=1 Tax=Chironomus riparius TaxID=315576 RepID=A0A9N9RYV4_9DIPT|nr:unnamed protein product [Chironomus riparius]
MEDLFKKTMNYFNTGSVDDDFVGQIVEVGAMKLKIMRKIAEGGFAIVYVAKDIQNGNEYALKRLFGSDKDECNNIIKEINIHKQISGHINIVKFITASFIDRTKNSGRAEYLLVTELCQGGSLYDCLDQSLEPAIVLKVMYQATKAVAHLHSQNINHRDIKIENFLIGSDGMLKLCDFGSSTLESHSPDLTWTTQQRNNLEEFLQKFTTPMYRAPEQLDTWNNYQIGVKTDVWALGCILFCLCYKKHPFEDGAKLGIINGNYTIPNDSRFGCFNDIIKGCFVVDPSNRFDVNVILERLGAISETKGWSLKGELGIKGKSLNSPTHEINNGNQSSNNSTPPVRPAPPIPVIPQVQQQQIRQQPPAVPPPPQISQTAPQASSSGLFSSIKGGAGSFLKNLKDTSSKVMQTVQQTMTKTDMDISFITQRIIVMPCPSEGIESAYKTNHIEDIKMFIEQRYQPSKVSIYNLGPRCARLQPPIRTVECGFIYAPNPPKAPILSHMYALAEDMYGFLNNDPKNVIIVQSPDNGKGISATMVCALMLYAQLIREPEDAMQMFAVKRIPPNMRPSELRYSYYMADIIRSHFPHNKPITLVSINFSPIPRMTKARDGCRLYIEVTANDRVAISTLQEYDRMRLYHASEGKANLPLNITLCGDITVTLYHARNAIAGIGKPQSLKICQLQFHSGFIPEEETLLSFNRSELDDIPDAEHVPNNFNLSLSVFVGDDDRAPVSQPPWLSQNQQSQRDPKLLFSSQLEYEENVDNFITKPTSNNSTGNAHVPPPRPSPPKRPDPPKSEDFTQSYSDEGNPIESKINDKSEPPIVEFDFLNLNNDTKAPEQPKQVPKVKEPSFDLLGGFDTNFSDPFPDIIGSALNKPTGPVVVNSGSNGNLDDIFGSLPSSSAPPIVPSKSSNDLNGLNFNAGSSFPNKGTTNNVKKQEEVKKDPFADLTQLGGGLFGKSASNPFSATPQNSSTNASPRNNPSTPIHQMKSPNNEPSRPDYSRSHFQEPTQAQASQKTSQSGDIFGDILGQQGYSFGKTTQGPRSINEMRKVELVQTMDPEKLKVMEWIEGKRGNVRALLCTVDTILWDNAKWTKCEMSSLMTANDVKKAYRRCCLAVHPDKHAGTDNENLAKLIFMELNNAFSDFENDASKQNLF